MSVNVHLSYSPVAVASHFMISIPYVPVATGIASAVFGGAGAASQTAEVSVPAINACVLMAMFTAVRKYVSTDNSLITDLGINYCDGCANIHGAIHRFKIERVKNEIIKMFTKWKAASVVRTADKYCARLGFNPKAYKPVLRDAVPVIDSGVPGPIDIYILTRNKNPAVAAKNEAAPAKARRVEKQNKAVKALTELQSTVKQMVQFRRAAPVPPAAEGIKYAGLGAFIISKLLGVESFGSYIDADKDRIKASCAKFAERLAKKSKPEKSLWHLNTMAICSGNCTAAAIADFAGKIGNDEAIDFIKKLYTTK